MIDVIKHLSWAQRPEPFSLGKHFPETLADEINQALRNVERTLATAGASWEHVIVVNSYHVGFRRI